MDKIKEILKLKEGGFSYREIAASVGCSKSVVGDTLRRAETANIQSGHEHTETEFEALLFPEKKSNVDSKELDMMYILAELSRKHVTSHLPFGLLKGVSR
jgi:DNA invertase Pin-like site-specific DNA recombinase